MFLSFTVICSTLVGSHFHSPHETHRADPHEVEILSGDPRVKLESSELQSEAASSAASSNSRPKLLATSKQLVLNWCDLVLDVSAVFDISSQRLRYPEDGMFRLWP